MKNKYLLPEDDGLPTREFGKWTIQKVEYLKKYISQSATSMRGKPWRQRSYIDMFSGTGKFELKGTNDIHLGSPLLALTTQHPFTHYYFVDYIEKNIDILRERSSSLPLQKKFYVGDANEKVKEIVRELQIADKKFISGKWPSFNLVFLDPDGLELEWRTVEALAQIKIMDMVIHYSQSGLTRNLDRCYASTDETIIDKFFGDEGWRQIYKTWQYKSSKKGLHRELMDYYQDKLKALGYVDIDSPEPLMKTAQTNAPLYRLVFASKHKLGHKFWKQGTQVDINGQRRLL
ncbi:MAG: three-Cys-motif partner protein TcmP [Chloroflexi bacterium]|nr:three-Cys-motif partner protein TcmP [Chloroflexota bacterium]